MLIKKNAITDKFVYKFLKLIVTLDNVRVLKNNRYDKVHLCCKLD
jgi:hypothetical protein